MGNERAQTRRRRWPTVVVLVGAFACTDDPSMSAQATSDTTGESSTSEDASPSDSADETMDLELIDDMEDGDHRIAAVAGRRGRWSTHQAKGPPTIDPPSDQPFVMTALDSPRAGSHYAACIRATPSESWGSVVQLDLRRDDTQREALLYDAGQYHGVRFWLKSRSGHTQSNLKFSVRERRTDVLGGVCHPEYDGCSDHFEIDIEPTEQWRQWVIPFADLEQTWPLGLPLDALDRSSIYGFEIAHDSGATADYCIDDLRFYTDDPD